MYNLGQVTGNLLQTIVRRTLLAQHLCIMLSSCVIGEQTLDGMSKEYCSESHLYEEYSLLYKGSNSGRTPTITHISQLLSKFYHRQLTHVTTLIRRSIRMQMQYSGSQSNTIREVQGNSHKRRHGMLSNHNPYCQRLFFSITWCLELGRKRQEFHQFEYVQVFYFFIFFYQLRDFSSYSRVENNVINNVITFHWAIQSFCLPIIFL